MNDLNSKKINELARDIVNRNVIIVAGTGVSLLSLDEKQKKIASWKGLLQSGMIYCEECQLVNEKQKKLISDQIESNETIFMTCAAQQIVHFMGGRGINFKRWIKQTIAKLKISDNRLIKKILKLNCPIITTNYDDLIEQVCGMKYYTANNDKEFIIEQIRNYRNAIPNNYDPHIIHLHGHYNHLDSLVFDISSYEDITRNQQVQELLRSIDTTLTYLFIGCGVAGLTDPNFGPLLHRSNELFSNINSKHYRLVKNEELLNEHDTNNRMIMLEYGEKYDDIIPFMDILLEQVEEVRKYQKSINDQLEIEKYHATMEASQEEKEELELLEKLMRKYNRTS